MKKLNRKGFTLIELLAVIVILAIIVVVTVPTIINTIADARVQSIWNLAGSTANSYDTMKAQDLLANDKTVSDFNVTEKWQCISSVPYTGTENKTLADVLDLSANDVTIEDKYSLTFEAGADTPTGITKGTAAGGTCSAIRLNSTSDGAEILLVAKEGGKFDVSGKNVYALSTEDSGHPAKGE